MTRCNAFAICSHRCRERVRQRPTDRDAQIDAACLAAQRLRLYWVDHAPKPSTRRVEAQPGRNDPCHCGSGLKFKKCHGAAR